MESSDYTYRELKLGNGLYVALQSTPTQTIAGRLRVHLGALNEKEREEGLAHFLEHCLYSGGSRKYTPKQSDEVKKKFGYTNSNTHYAATRFPVDMLSERLELYLDFVSSLALYPRLDSNTIDKQRQRVLREISDDKGRPSFQDIRNHVMALYREHPYSYYIYGKEDVIASANIDNLLNLHSRGYHTNNMDLILVGGLPDNTEELVRKNFEVNLTGNGECFKFPPLQPLEKNITFHTQARYLFNQDLPEESNSEILLDIVTCVPAGHEDRRAVGVVSEILGGGPFSRIFTKISNELGLTYGIGTNYITNDNTGIIEINGKVHARRQDEVIDAIFEEMNRLREELVDSKELERIIDRTSFDFVKVLEPSQFPNPPAFRQE